MDRRAFIGSLAGILLAAPLAAKAQPARMTRVGWLLPDPKPFALDPFRQRLKELGWNEGSNLAIEQRYSSGIGKRYPQLVAELIRLRVDVLVTDGAAATRAAQQTAPTTPIVFVSGNPVSQGFVESLPHPGRNLTGVAILTGDLNPKRIQLLSEAVTGIARLAIVEDLTAAGIAIGDANWPMIEATLRHLDIQLIPTIKIHRREELDGAFALAARARAGGVLVLASPFFSSQGKRIARLAANARLPAVYEHRGFVEAGGLMSYGPDHREMFGLVAQYVDKILRGARPGDLPIEQPTKFELVINLKTAKALGLTIPPSLLVRADQVIQ